MKRYFKTLLIFAGLCPIYLLAQNTNISKFPGALVTDRDLGVAADRSTSMLAGDIDSTTLTIPVLTGHGVRFKIDEFITIQNEHMQICSISGDTLTMCAGSRGLHGTAAVSHSEFVGLDPVPVDGFIIADHVNQPNAEIKEMQAGIGINRSKIWKLDADNATVAETTTTINSGATKPGLRLACGALPSAPGSAGVIVCNSADDNKLYWWDGTNWAESGSGGGGSGTGVPNPAFERTGVNFAIDTSDHEFTHSGLIVAVYDYDTRDKIEQAIHVDESAPYTVRFAEDLPTSRHMLVVISGGGGPPGISDGDKGDITVSGTGAVWDIDAGVVSATDVPFTQAGTGAVARTVQDKLRETVFVTDFGAVDDNSTNNKADIKEAIAEAIARKANLHFPATAAGGVYKTSSGFVINSTLNITCDPGVVIDTTGTDDTAHHGFSFIPTFTLHDITGTPAVGAVALTVADAASFAVGDEVQVQIGAEPFDYTLNYVSYFTKIVAISGTTVTVDVPVPEAVPSTLTPGTSPNSRIVKFTTSTNHSSVRCAFRVTDSVAEDGSGSSPNFDQWIYAQRTKDLTLDVRGIRVAGSIVLDYSENVRIENLVVDHAVRRNAYGASGSALTGWGCRNCSAGNVILKHIGYDGVHLEGQTRGFHIDHLWIERSPLDQGSGMAVLSGSLGVTVDTYHYYGPGASATAASNPWYTNGHSKLRIKDAYLYNLSDNAELNLDVGLESLGINGTMYKNKQRVRLVYPLLVSSGGTDLGLPDGTYTRFDSYFSTATGLTNIYWGACASVVYDNTNPPIIQPAAWQRLPHLNLWGNQHPFSRCPEGKRTYWFTDGTVPVNSYVILEIEYFPLNNTLRHPVYHNDPPTSGVTRANPTQVRYEQHGLTTGDTVVVAGAPGDCTAMNGSYAVTVTDHENYTIPYNSTSGCATDVTYAEAAAMTISRSTGDGGPSNLRPGDMVFAATDKRIWNGVAFTPITDANTASSIMYRDASGNFKAGNGQFSFGGGDTFLGYGAGDIYLSFNHNSGAGLFQVRRTDGTPEMTIQNGATTVAGPVNAASYQQGGVALNLTGSTYTPTLTNVTNLDGSTAFQCQYMRIASTVTGSCRVSVDPTAAVATELGISLPVASDFGAVEDAAGSCAATGIAGQSAGIEADSTNDRMAMKWVAVDLTAQVMTCSFSYQVI